jgi:hypothetical protein
MPGSSTPPGQPSARDNALGRVAFRFRNRVGTRKLGFRGSMAGLRPPLPTLRRRPCERQRTARGRCGSLLLHRLGLSPITPCRSPGALRIRYAQPRSRSRRCAEHARPGLRDAATPGNRNHLRPRRPDATGPYRHAAVGGVPWSRAAGWAAIPRAEIMTASQAKVRRGVGGALLGWSETWARSSKCDYVALWRFRRPLIHMSIMDMNLFERRR